MKALKIILAIAVVGVASIFILISLTNTPVPDSHSEEIKNLFVERIEKDIAELQGVPDNTFSTEKHREIQDRIKDFYDEGNLGSDTTENEVQFKNLSRNLYTVYAPKFISQAEHVYRGSVWGASDLQKIQREADFLLRSQFLQSGSDTDVKIRRLTTVLGDYYQMSDFIHQTIYFNFAESNIDDASSVLTMARNYLANKNDMGFVKYCTRLWEGLDKIPENLLEKHYTYLRHQIYINSGRYKDFESHLEYSRKIYAPLSNSLRQFDNDIYKVSNSLYNKRYYSLSEMLTDDNRAAVNYPY